jgi:hypothetical protein
VIIVSLGAIVLPVFAIWPWLRSVPALTRLQRVIVAFGCGVAASSIVFFLWRVVGWPVVAYRLFDPALWLAVGATGAWRARGASRRTDARTAPASWALVAIATVVIVLSVDLLATWIAAHPLGRWDAWAVWNLKARFLVAPSAAWHGVFQVVPSQPDYPLLLPSAIARAWILLGRTADAVPAVLSIVCAAAAVLTVTASLSAIRRPALAIAGLVLTAVPAFVLLGAAQMADVPLALFTVLAVTLLAAPESTATLVLAGALAGSAAWTKNEGIVVAAALPISYVLVRLRRDGASSALRAARDLYIGLLPVAIVVVGFKLRFAPQGQVVGALLTSDAWREWRDIGRLVAVGRYMAHEAIGWGGWPIGGPIWALALLLVYPRGPVTKREPAVLAAGLLLITQVIAIVCAYVTTRNPLMWQMQTTAFRLIAQIWPTAVWWVCATRGHANGRTFAS